jgi:diguanylate cyclase (GGDEF)-like protein
VAAIPAREVHRNSRGNGLPTFAGIAWVSGVAAVDGLWLRHVVLISLLALGPLVTALKARWRATLLVASYALGAAIALGARDKIAGSAQQASDCLLVAMVGAVAAWASWALRARETALQEAQQLATVDSLTGALTRRAFAEQAEALYRIRPHQRPSMSVALIDIDRFKLVNDSFGHAAGDTVLAEVAARFAGKLRAADLLCRYGGEEFAFLLLHDQPFELVSRLVACVADEPVRASGHDIPVTVSAGWADAGDDVWDALQQADACLYLAKRNGGNVTIGS